MTINGRSTIDILVRNLRCSGINHPTLADPDLAQRRRRRFSGLGWQCLAPADIRRQRPDVLVEDWTWSAPVGLNSESVAIPHRAVEVLYKLRASVPSDGRIRGYVSVSTS
ncbi:hypothetical protein BE17_29275 [Sorangium cellulosum]|uniref:Uncharacterized protein n=1 Tax=Sorangium cellulosum TaxID=56 RepID=A0A150RRT4_SORCE|nr:hypothetical protein BE17_29275 [Sorangium cellulosum]